MISKAVDWFSRRAGSYARVVVVLGLNVPFLCAALSRYLSGVNWASIGGVYAALVFLGYYGLLILGIITCLFLVTGAWPRLFLAASGVLFTLVLYYFVVDGVVYRFLKSHLDGFWLMYLATTSFEGLGVGVREIVLGLALLAGVALLQWLLFRIAARVQVPRRWVIVQVVACVVAYGASQTLHVLAYGANDTRIVALTPQLPFYLPITSSKHASKYRDQVPLIKESSMSGLRAEAGAFRYPLHEVSCSVPAGHRKPNVVIFLVESLRADVLNPTVMPRMTAFAQRSSLFLNHFSTGNSTPAGVFPVLYGIYPTYWDAVKANNALIHNPVLVKALEANGYGIGVYAPNSHFERHKIKETCFRDIDVREAFSSPTDEGRDREMTDLLLEFMKRQKASGKPFMTFSFYKSTHYPYSYPADMAPFQPVKELNPMLASRDDDPTPIRNDYWNSVHYVDALMGELLDRMEAEHLLDDTIVVMTGDHAEEFNDNRDNTWGHTGNFTRYQVQVPLIVYVPWQKPRRVTSLTSQVDIAPTLMQEALGCGQNTKDYSNGLNLFGPLPDRRPLVIGSYVTHALILGDDVFVSWPMYVQRYKVDGSKDKVGWPPSDLLNEALKGMGVFYGREDRPLAGGAPAPDRKVAAGGAAPDAN